MPRWCAVAAASGTVAASVSVGAAQGATVRTESVETMIDGGIAFATPDGEQMGNPARPQQTFALFEKAEDEWLQWAPKIQIAK